MALIKPSGPIVEVSPTQHSIPCPALSICQVVGNYRKGCEHILNRSSEDCLAGLILLIARSQNLWPQEMEAELQKRRHTGPSSTAD